MKTLLMDYNAKDSVSFDDIVAFHAEFEYIHPFQDGNGRVGRLIALKECLRHDIVPFIIEDSKKISITGDFPNGETKKGFLIGTCRDSQDTFKGILKELDVD